MARIDLAGAVWRKSSYSQSDGACVEVALTPPMAGIRDSKDPGGGVLVTSLPAWEAFRGFSKSGDVAGAWPGVSRVCVAV
jgi:hypothetical protein